jgi:hypothetical protein
MGSDNFIAYQTWGRYQVKNLAPTIPLIFEVLGYFPQSQILPL